MFNLLVCVVPCESVVNEKEWMDDDDGGGDYSSSHSCLFVVLSS